MLITPALTLFGGAVVLEWIAKAALVIVMWTSTRASRIRDEHDSAEAEIQDLTLMLRRPALWAVKHPVRFARRRMRSMIDG